MFGHNPHVRLIDVELVLRVSLSLWKSSWSGGTMSLLRRSLLSFVQEFARGCKNPRKPQYSKRSQIGLYAGKDIRCGKHTTN